MANFFDQFDPPEKSGGNFFDRFDEPQQQTSGGNFFDQFDTLPDQKLPTQKREDFLKRIPGIGETQKAPLPEGMYDADNPPYADDQFIKDRKVVNGKEYRLHGPTGVIYDPDNKAVVDPVVLQAFGRKKPNQLAQKIHDANKAEQSVGIGDYATEAKNAAVRGAGNTIGGTIKGAALATTSDPKAVAEIEQGITNIRSMPYEEAEAFRKSIKDRVRALNLNPLAAVNYEAALRATWRGDTETAKGYLETARTYSNTGAVKDQPIYQAGEALTDAVRKDFPQDPRFADSWWSAIFEGAGSTVPFIPAGFAGPTTVAGLGALASGSEGYDSARRDIENGQYRDDRGGLYNAGYGAEAENVARQAGQASMLPGLSEAAPIELLVDQTIGRIPFFKTPAGANLWQRGRSALLRIGAQVLAEGGQEGFQTWANNVINRIMVDPSQSDWENVPANAAVGGIVGGGMQVGAEAIGAVTGRGEQAPPPPEPPPPADPVDPQLFPGTPPATPPSTPPGASPPPAGPQPAPTNPVVTGASTDDYLLADGYSPEQIADMTPDEKRAALDGAIERGAQPAQQASSQPAPSAPPAAETPPSASAGPAQAAPRHPPGPATWANADFDQPVNIVDEPPQQDPASGKWFQRIEDGNGGSGFVPFDELQPQARTAPAPGTAPRAPRAAKSQPAPAAPEDDFDALLDDAIAQEFGGQGVTNDATPAPADPAVVNRQLEEYIAGKKPLTQEAFAKHAGIDVNEAGKALQRAHAANWIYLGPKGYRRHPTRVAPLDVLEFVAAKGGVSDPTGELKALDLHKPKYNSPSYGPVVRRTGMHPDKMREALIDAGYIRDAGRDAGGQLTSTVADFYDVMGRAAGGEKIYAEMDQAKAAGLEAERKNRDLKPTDWEDRHPIETRYGPEVWNTLQQTLAAYDSYEEAWSQQEINDMARFIADGMEPETAVERAAIMHVDDLREDEDIAPEITAAFERTQLTDMLDLPPFPEETTPNAAQLQEAPEDRQGVRPARAAGDQAGSEAEAGSAGAQVRDAGEDGAEAGGQGPDAGQDAEGQPDEVGRPRRNAINSNALEDALSPQAQAALAAYFKRRNASRDLRYIREAMEVYQRALDGGLDAEAEAVRQAAEAFFTDQTSDNADELQSATYEGLQAITGEEDPDPNQELLENEVFASAQDAGELVFQTLDPRTASFDIEEFNTAYGDVEFRRPQENVFPPVEEQKRIWKEVGLNRISQDEADARIQKWKDYAKLIGKKEDHSKEVIFSLFDVTGKWSQPYRDAGYKVIQYDIQSGQDLMKFGDWMSDVENVINEGDNTIVGILAAPPCTTFASSGTRWWQDIHNKADKEMIIKTFGDVWAADFFETPLEYANALVAVVKLIVEQADPKFYAMENPVGRIKSQNHLPDALLSFDPANFGNPYTKRTLLWGEFNTNLPTANVDPYLGSLMHKLRGNNPKQKKQRSDTPEGFAYAFFAANNTSDYSVDKLDELRALPDWDEAQNQKKKASKAPSQRWQDKKPVTPVDYEDIPNPVNNKPVNVDAEPDERLILMACGAEKAKLAKGEKVKPIDLYTGAMYQVLKKWMPKLDKGKVVILSAKHGIVPGTGDMAEFSKIESYDERMTPKKAKHLVEAGIYGGWDDFGRIKKAATGLNAHAYLRPDGRNAVPYKDVFIAGGGEYRKVFHAYITQMIEEGLISPDASINEVTGGIGEQRGQLGEYLRKIAGEKPAEQTAAPNDTEEEDSLKSWRSYRAPVAVKGKDGWLHTSNENGAFRDGDAMKVVGLKEKKAKFEIRVLEAKKGKFVSTGMHDIDYHSHSSGPLSTSSLDRGRSFSTPDEAVAYEATRLLDTFESAFRDKDLPDAKKRDVKKIIAKLKELGGKSADAVNPAPTTEAGADNKPQLVIPGAEQDRKGALQNAANKPMRAATSQKPMDVGLFGSERDQTDLFDAPKPKDTTDRRDEAWPILDELEALDFPAAKSFAKGMRGALEGTPPITADSVTFYRQKLADFKAQAANTGVEAEKPAEGRTLESHVFDNPAEVRLIRAVLEATPELQATKAMREADRAYQRLAAWINDKGFKVNDVNSFNATPEIKKGHSLLGGLAGSAMRVAKSQDALSKGYERGSEAKLTTDIAQLRASTIEAEQFVGTDETSIDDALEAAMEQELGPKPESKPKPAKGYLQGNWWEPLMGGEEKSAKKPKTASLEEQGAQAFAAGKPRRAPLEMWKDKTAKEGNKDADKWLKGWDRANMAAPVEATSMPEGYELTLVRKLTADDVKGTVWTAGQFKAVVVRAKPYGSYDAVADTREEAIAKALADAQPKTAGQAAKSAAKNTLKGMDEVATGLQALFGGKNKLSSGFTFDEETYRQALPYFKAGAAHLKEAAKDMKELAIALVRALKGAGMTADAIEAMKPYLKRFMQDVRDGKETLEADAPKSESPFHPIVVAFVDYLSQPDAAFDTITEARKFAADRGFKAEPGTPAAKDLDEMLEQAIVLTARTIVGASKKRPAQTAYRRLVDLYNRQPNLGVRTSESMAEQAYSTPAPLAFIASRLAGVAGAKSVLEPTAGNGMLLIEATAANATVNELNQRRANSLTAQGFRTTQLDAATESLRHKGYPVEVVIENPPFGAVKQSDGSSKEFDVDGWKTTQIDHAIALNTLKSMADDGRAVLIVGSVKEGSDKSRSDSYNTKQKREFYWRLYQGYNVTDHFTVAGDLYKRQGAAWPVDVIVIEGRGKSARSLPSVDLPKIYDTWESLEEKLDEAPVQSQTRSGQKAGGAAVSGPAVQRDGAQDAAGLETGSTGNRPASDVGRPSPGTAAPAGQAPVPDGSGQREPARLGEQQPAKSDGSEVPTGERELGDGDRKPAAPPRERLKQDAGAAQQTYKPMSGLKPLDTKIPTNMADAVEQSLGDLSDRYGAIDQWIEKELGYKKGDLGKYLAAEQVDAVAMALDNVKKNAAFIIGDQTGIGKGRVVASALRYAMRNGLVPIFVTEKPNLYGDIIRDLIDIGVPEMLGRELKPFLTNQGAAIPLDDEAVQWFDEAERAKVEGKPVPPKRGKFLRSSGGDLHKRQMAALQKDGTGKDFDIVFTTYDQMNTVKGATTDRRRLVDGLADRAFIVLDESHNAGGTEASERGSKKGDDSRSDFLKKVTGKAKAVMFSSATYAKRPGVMALYARTDMGKAVERPEMLGELISRGGVPMQQIVASMLAKAGQYIRRERSFDGVSYDVEPVTVDTKAYEAVSKSLSTIARFDIELKKSDTWKEIKENLKENAEAAAMDSGAGEVSVNSTNFTSLMHNIVNQMLLAIKTDAVATRAIDALKAGEKPVITVANTMGAFLKTYAEENDVKRGDPVNLSFRDVLIRYLERTRRLTIKRPDGTTYHYTIPLTALPGYMQKAYREAEALIGAIDTTNLPISPIDWLRHRLAKAGYRVSEITGRKDILEYGGPDNATFSQRLDSEVSPAGRRVNIDKFNRGDIDVMILNRAGSTGLSLHASSKFKDQRRRRMIIAQAELNIDVHMQMLGRVHRTGQVIPPAFVQAYADVPAEARPAAVLAKKMASLNANTTASRKSAFSADDSVDFLNEYGDQVAREFLKENPEMADDLNVGMDPEDETARELTGKLLLLPVSEQKRALDEITARYKVLIENLDAMGENALEAKTIDLGAKTISRQELKSSEGDSPFTQAVILEEVEVKSEGKALPMKEILDTAIQKLGAGAVSTDNPEVALDTLNRLAKRDRTLRFSKWFDDFDRMVVDDIKATKTDDVREQRRAAYGENRRRFNEITDLVMPGYRIDVRAKDGATLTGIVMNVYRRGETGKTGNPLALGAWVAEIAIPDNAQRINVPFSSMALPGDSVKEGERKVFISTPDWSNGVKQTLDAFEKARQTGKETRYIVTGNILGGYDQTRGSGQIVNYTDDQGNVKPGILMARTFSPKEFLNSRAVRFRTASQVMQFLKRLPNAEIISHDGVITVRQQDARTEIELPASRQTGGTYFLNPDVRKAAADRFTKVGSRMRYQTTLPESATRVLDEMMKAGAVFQTTEQQDVAEEIITGKKPEARKQAPLASAPRRQVPLASAARQVFYSGLLRAVEGMKQDKAPKTQWMGMIRNAPGVKPEELQWIGLDDWLSQQSGNITKLQIIDFIKANQVEVKEVVNEQTPDHDVEKMVERIADQRYEEQLKEEYNRLADEDEGGQSFYTAEREDEDGNSYWAVMDGNTDEEIERFDTELEADTEAETLQDRAWKERRIELERMAEDNVDRAEIEREVRWDLEHDGSTYDDPTKYSKYQLPGGSNYRELLITMPVGDAVKISGSIMIYNNTDADSILTDISAEGFEDLDYGRETDASGNEQIYFNDLNEMDLEAFKAIAWKNGGHLVVENKRGTKDTYRSSHWDEPNILAHIRFNERTDKEGKKVLFVEEIQSDWHQKGRKTGYKMSDAELKSLRDQQKEIEAEIQKQGKDASPKQQARWMEAQRKLQMAQNGVLVPDAPFKTTWPELAMKRVIRWAAENGFDRVAWTPGEVQADRYDLSQHIDAIAYQKRGDSYGLEIREKGAVQTRSIGEHSAKQLESQVGKELADKIINGDGKVVGFYGADKGWTVLEGLDLKIGGSGMKAFYDKMLVDVANKLGKKFGAKVRNIEIPRYSKVGLSSVLEPHVVPSFDITPEMRAAAMQGQPLFKKGAKTAIPNTSPSIIEKPKLGQNPYQFVLGKNQAKVLIHEVRQAAQRILGRHLVSVDIYEKMPNGQNPHFDPNTEIIKMALKCHDDPRLTLRHEAVHLLRQAGVMSSHEWSILSRQAAARWINQYDIRERYEQMYRESMDITPDQLEELLLEEAIADAFAEYWVGDGRGEDVVSRIFYKLKQFLEAVANLARGHGFKTADSIMSAIESGDVGNRERGSGQDRGFVMYAKQQSRPQAKLYNTPADDGGGARTTFATSATTTTVEEDRVLEEFAGNINLNYIDGPESLKDVLRDASNQADGFMGARRGVVSHDQTRMLAEQMGMTVRQLLSRRKGQAFNAHEAFAARAMLVKSGELVKQAAARVQRTRSDVDRAYFMRMVTRHAAIQEQVAGMTAEAGRALNQFRMMAGADYLRSITEALNERSINGAIGTNGVDDLAGMVDSMEQPAQVATMARAVYRPNFLDKIREFYINSLLSGPSTQTVNLMSNLLTAVNQIPEQFLAEQIGKLHGGEKVEKGEAIAKAVGLLEGSREGLRLAWATLKTGEQHTPETQFDQRTGKAISGLKGEIIRIPSRLMMSSDDFFKAVNYRAELNALAVRMATREGLEGQALAARIQELRDNPTDQMISKAQENARYQTFQNKLGPKGQILMRFREAWHLWPVLPFLRTPINILKYATERTPLGPLLMKDARDRLTGKRGRVAQDIQISRMVLGTLVMAGMASMVLQGMVTGGGPDDEKEKSVKRATGWQPYSFQIGNGYYSYLRFDPFALHLGIVADMIELRDKVKEGDYAQVGWNLLASIIGNIADKTWLRSATQFTEMVNDPQRYVSHFVGNLVTGFVPNFSAQVARVNDPSFRDARTVLDRVKERIPGYKETLPQRFDIFGEPIKGEGNLGPDLFSPVYVSTKKDNPIAKALIEAQYFPGQPRRHINGHDLTPEQYAEYTEMAGKEAVRRLTRIVQADSWSRRSQDSQEKVLKLGFDQARELARKKLMAKYPELRKKPAPTP